MSEPARAFPFPEPYAPGQQCRKAVDGAHRTDGAAVHASDKRARDKSGDQYEQPDPGYSREMQGDEEREERHLEPACQCRRRHKEDGAQGKQHGIESSKTLEDVCVPGDEPEDDDREISIDQEHQ